MMEGDLLVEVVIFEDRAKLHKEGLNLTILSLELSELLIEIVDLPNLRIFEKILEVKLPIGGNHGHINVIFPQVGQNLHDFILDLVLVSVNLRRLFEFGDSLEDKFSFLAQVLCEGSWIAFIVLEETTIDIKLSFELTL
jgi:hypothetical protein